MVHCSHLTITSLLVLQVTQYLLEAALTRPDSSGRSFIDKILLTLIFHCSRDQDHERAIKVIQETASRERILKIYGIWLLK